MSTFRFAIVVGLISAGVTPAQSTGPFAGKKFVGRIAWSADGNHNDPDDWAASPVALAIFAECGLKDRLVHFDYNCILPQTDPVWEKKHADSVLGAVAHYGYTPPSPPLAKGGKGGSIFHDCRKDLDAALASITRAVNESTAENPLYFIVAGPMEVPVRGIEKSDPEKRKFVYCISHSRWNDGFAAKYKFTHTKRSVIASGVNWVQIQDQNRLLSFGQFGRPSTVDKEWQPYFWMRDSKSAAVRFLWERMQVSTRPDPSDAGMAYFLATGDEQADPMKLKRLLDDHTLPTPVEVRTHVRLEAENFRELTGFEIEDRNDKAASHRLNVKGTGAKGGRISTRFNEPYASAVGRFDVEIRYQCAPAGKFTLSINGVPQQSWESTAKDGAWTTHTIKAVEIRRGDEIALDVQGAAARVDYVQVNRDVEKKTKS